MKELILRPASLVWAGLMLATALSWWLGSTGSADGDLRRLSTALIVVAFIKVRFVMQHFMEVREAVVPIRLLSDAWLVLAGGAVLGLYWWPL